MSFISSLFKPPEVNLPAPTPPAPRIGDAEIESKARASRQRLSNRYGTEDTILTGGRQGLGDVGAPAPMTSSPAMGGSSNGRSSMRGRLASLLGG